MIRRLEREKELVVRLTELLKEEVEFITNQNVEALEDSMPEKQKVLREISMNRQGIDSACFDPSSALAPRMRHLKNDLIILWKKASGLNDLSKAMVTGRLAEIERELEPFLARSRTGYTRDGKKSGHLARTVLTGV
jgi:hypothetical protein